MKPLIAAITMTLLLCSCAATPRHGRPSTGAWFEVPAGVAVPAHGGVI